MSINGEKVENWVRYENLKLGNSFLGDRTPKQSKIGFMLFDGNGSENAKGEENLPNCKTFNLLEITKLNSQFIQVAFSFE